MTEVLIEGAIRLKVIEPQPPVVVVLSTTYAGITIATKGAMQMAYTLPADKMVELRIAYQDANGNPATIDGLVAWDSSNPSIASVSPITTNPPADGSAVNLIPGTQVGNCQISARADADLGAGVRELVTLLDVTVVGGEAVTGVITPGEAVPKA